MDMSQTKAQAHSEVCQDGLLSGNSLFYLQHNGACVYFRSHKKETNSNVHKYADLMVFASWLFILCSATVYVLTNTTPELPWYYRLYLFGDTLNQTVCVNQKFKQKQRSRLYCSETAGFQPSFPPLPLQFIFGLAFYFFFKPPCLNESTSSWKQTVSQIYSFSCSASHHYHTHPLERRPPHRDFPHRISKTVHWQHWPGHGSCMMSWSLQQEFSVLQGRVSRLRSVWFLYGIFGLSVLLFMEPHCVCVCLQSHLPALELFALLRWCGVIFTILTGLFTARE